MKDSREVHAAITAVLLFVTFLGLLVFIALGGGGPWYVWISAGGVAVSFVALLFSMKEYRKRKRQ